MTRARIAAYGVGSPPPLQRWLNAVLLLCVSLVQGVAAMFGMRKRNKDRDWHTKLEPKALPQTKRDIQVEDIFGPASRRLAVDAQRRTQTLTQTTIIGFAACTRQEVDLLVGVARGGGHPVLRAAQTHSHMSALTRVDQTPACAGEEVERLVRLKSA
jgi:hypothetical protein